MKTNIHSSWQSHISSVIPRVFDFQDLWKIEHQHENVVSNCQTPRSVAADNGHTIAVLRLVEFRLWTNILPLEI